MKGKFCELLAPAGNLECALSALDAGADAVYCGLSRFNARSRADNFDTDRLGALIDHMHRKGKKLYLTFNTLLFEEELEAAGEMLGELTGLAPDALIVHDPGVIRMVKKYFPSLRVHASTQMGVHNSAGAVALAELGAERVILERQLPLSEVERIVKKSPVEIEVFLHGSLCCSLSGRCLLSAELCGGSGNRGCCKQPCRRAFETEKGRIFPLSMRDLNGLETLPFLREIGVASLKIEGRLRGPDYVWKCVRAYRMLLDSPPGRTPPGVAKEAAALLKASSARGEIAAFDARSMVDSARIGVFGRPAAAVEKLNRRGMLVKALSKLHLGDRLRLVPPDGGEGMSFSLIAMEDRQKKIHSLQRGGTAFIPGVFSAAPGWQLFKIGENGFDFSRQAAALPPRRAPLHLRLKVSSRLWECRIKELPAFLWRRETALGGAEKHPASPDEIAAVFSSGAPEPWRIGKAEVKITGEDFFLPAATLKSLRREFWNSAAEALKAFDPGKAGREAAARFAASLVPRSSPPSIPETAESLFEIPGFIPENDLPLWKGKIAAAIENGQRHFRAGGFHALTLLKDFPEIVLSAVFPLAVTNSQCAALLEEKGFRSAALSPETPERSIELLRSRSPLPLFHDPVPVPLLVSRAELAPAGIWHDRSGMKLELRFDPAEKLWKLWKK